jgi:chromosome segregation ATPase
MTDEELVKQALAELGDIVRCHCDEACISRGLHDPSCNCDSSEALATVKKHIRKLTEQLEQLVAINEAARADAKEAEAYAEGLERDLKTCCMAQTVMDNTVAELERERDEWKASWQEVLTAGYEIKAKLATCEEIGRAFEKDAGQLRDKLAKVVEALLLARVHVANNEQGWSVGRASARSDLEIINAKLAEIEGEKG